jgi:O-antigen biosynthesis protein WbqP
MVFGSHGLLLINVNIGLNNMIRLIDIVVSGVLLIILTPIMFFVFVVCLIDTGSPIFVQRRMGKDMVCFNIFKFRTMRIGVESKATHLMQRSDVTAIGRVLRATKIDELPQLLNVLCGDMSMVGPRPNLIDQHEVIRERDKLQVYCVRPGITGVAQIKGVDMSNPKMLVAADYYMIRNMSVALYIKCVVHTVWGSGRGDRISG